MPTKTWITVLCLSMTVTLTEGQPPQGFFLDSWQPRTVASPLYNNVQQTNDQVTVAITVDLSDTITKVSRYLFGDNANLWTGCMSDNKALMKKMADREMGVLRGPGGSISDVFFWNRNREQRPSDIPNTLVGSAEVSWPWYGDRPFPGETWTMDVDSFYSILAKTGSTGMITVNYGYARYGTSDDPVAQAAHMAADWVRYDKGRTKFWEIGNEVFGSWEAGYRINLPLNKDGQPEYITPALYGRHCRLFIDSMRVAAAETGAEIKIGVVMAEASSTGAGWNQAVATQAGDVADFYVVHSYYTPWNTNSDVATVLNSYTKTGDYKAYVWNEAEKAGKPKLPVALTEYNIFAVSGNQAVSHANGMHAVLVTGETMKTGYGAALRWDLANGWDKGNDHGMFSYNEPFVPDYTPHPAFYHLYYMRRHTGDVLLNSTFTGAPDVVTIPTAFSSGQIGISLINKSKIRKVIRLNLKNFKVGERFYTYTLTGTEGEDFSRRVFVNGIGPSLVAGGPEDYAGIKANSSVIGEEIRILLPPLSAVFVLVESGTKELAVNNQVTSIDVTSGDDDIVVFPNPATGSFTVRNISGHAGIIEILNLNGSCLFSDKVSSASEEIVINPGLPAGVYLISFRGYNTTHTKKLVINNN